MMHGTYTSKMKEFRKFRSRMLIQNFVLMGSSPLPLLDMPFVPHNLMFKSKEQCPFTKVPECPRTKTSNILRVQEILCKLVTCYKI